MLGLIATIPIYAQKFTKAEFNTKKFGQPQYLEKKKNQKQSHLVVNFNEVKYVNFWKNNFIKNALLKFPVSIPSKKVPFF